MQTKVPALIRGAGRPGNDGFHGVADGFDVRIWNREQPGDDQWPEDASSLGPPVSGSYVQMV